MVDLGPEVLPAWQMQTQPLRQRLGPIVLVAIGVIALGAAGYLYGVEHEPGGLPTAVGGLVVLGLGVFMLLRHGKLRQVITGYREGFSLGSHAIAFRDVRAITCDAHTQAANGSVVGVTTRMTIETAQGKHTFEDFDDGKPLSAQHIAHVFAGTAAALDKMQQPLKVGKLLVDAHGVQAARGLVPYATLIVSRFDKTLDLWVRGETAPLARIPLKAKNAVLAAELLQSRTPALTDDDEYMLFTRGSGRMVQIVVVLLALGGVAAAFIWGQTQGMLWLGAVAAIVLLPLTYLLLRAGTDFYTKRVHKRGVFSQTSLAYADVEQISYAAMHMYHNGVYTGTNITMKLAGSGKSLTVTTHSNQPADEAMERVRELASDIVARRMLQAVTSGGDAQWLPDFHLTQNAVRFHRSKLIGKGDLTESGYADTRYRIHDGRFELFIGNEHKPAYACACSAMNFYPGLTAFLALANPVAEHGSTAEGHA